MPAWVAWMPSSVNVSLSKSRAMRSRAVSLPAACWPGDRLVPAHPARASPALGEVLGVLPHVHGQRICPVRSSSHVLMPVSGGEPLSIVSIVAISLRWWVAWLATCWSSTPSGALNAWPCEFL